MSDSTNRKLALLAQVVKEYEQFKVVAHVATFNSEGKLESTSWQYGGSDPGAEYDGLAIHAYIGQGWTSGHVPDNELGVWGNGYSYDSVRIDSPKRATAIARVMTRLERGLTRIDRADGYLGHDDYAGYLIRISRVLKIKDIRVRCTPRQRDMTGEPFRLVTGSGLQSWVQGIDQAARAGKTGELIRS